MPFEGTSQISSKSLFHKFLKEKFKINRKKGENREVSEVFREKFRNFFNRFAAVFGSGFGAGHSSSLSSDLAAPSLLAWLLERPVPL